MGHKLDMEAARMMRIIPTSMMLIAAALVATALGGWSRPAGAQTPAPQLVIVFDGSGSMWGRLAGSPRSKLAAMREELSASLRQVSLLDGGAKFTHQVLVVTDIVNGGQRGLSD